MNKVNLEIVGLTYSESSTGAYVLILGDKHSRRRLPIVIGSAEAESIAVGNTLIFELACNLRHICGFSRDLLNRVIPNYDGFPQEEKMQCIDNALKERRSRMPARLTNVLNSIKAENIDNPELVQAMDDMEEPSTSQDTTEGHINKVEENESLDMLTLHELEDLLQEAIDNEDYQKAAQIRDEINGRKEV